MKKTIIISTLIFSNLFCFAQKGNKKLFAEYEDTLKILAHNVMHGETENKRYAANQAFIQHLKEVLKFEKSFKFPFDSLITISRISSPDDSFRIFNWLLRKDNNKYDYYAIIHYYNKKRNRYEVIELLDKSSEIRNPEQEELDARRWYGCLYYQIAYIKKSGRKYYTLIGWDGNDGYSVKKIIDVMYFSGKNKIKFGLPVFKINRKKSQNRVIFEYDSKTSISVKYNEKKQQIIFDNLIPIKEELQGLQEYYIPEGTFNAFQYNKGKWWLKENIDIRFKSKFKKSKKSEKGLLPR